MGTSEFVHELLDMAGKIQRDRKGLITQAESLRLALQEHKDRFFRELDKAAMDSPRIALRLHQYKEEKSCSLAEVMLAVDEGIKELEDKD